MKSQFVALAIVLAGLPALAWGEAPCGCNSRHTGGIRPAAYEAWSDYQPAGYHGGGGCGSCGSCTSCARRPAANPAAAVSCSASSRTRFAKSAECWTAFFPADRGIAAGAAPALPASAAPAAVLRAAVRPEWEIRSRTTKCSPPCLPNRRLRTLAASRRCVPRGNTQPLPRRAPRWPAVVRPPSPSSRAPAAGLHGSEPGESHGRASQENGFRREADECHGFHQRHERNAVVPPGSHRHSAQPAAVGRNRIVLL